MQSVVLDNDMEYIIVDSMEIDGTEIVLLSNVNDATDFCFRKPTIKDGKEVLSPLSGKEEFEKVLLQFGLKYEK